MGNSELTNCPVCGTPCTTEGHTTHYYKPVEKRGMDERLVSEVLGKVWFEGKDMLLPPSVIIKNQSVRICQTFRPAVDVVSLKEMCQHKAVHYFMNDQDYSKEENEQRLGAFLCFLNDVLLESIADRLNNPKHGNCKSHRFCETD